MNDSSIRRTAPPRRREEARALFRNAILDAAEVVFGEKGFHVARIQDVAERARIAVGTVYNHFEDKDDVLAALLDERTGEMAACLAPAADEPKGFGPRLTARIGRMLSYVEQHRAFFAIAFEHGLLGGGAAASAKLAGRRLRHVERFRSAFRALIEEGIASGALEPLDADALARFLGGSIRASLVPALSRSLAHPTEGSPRLDAESALIVDLFLHGASRRRGRKT
jgi:AcrR family transcriptional regulator